MAQRTNIPASRLIFLMAAGFYTMISGVLASCGWWRDLNEVKHFNILGPEPFSKEFTPALMREAFRKTIRPIKNVLLDHTFVAGIGNIYACEILFRSRLSPKRQARRISLAETKTIHRYIIEVLKRSDHSSRLFHA